jgi:nucleotide-binding universal stress UspA family protein
MAVQEELMIRFHKILCPVDFFPTSLRAFEYALKFAKNYGARVVALHVVEPLIPTVYQPAFSVPDLTDELEKESKRLMQNLASRAAKAGVPLETQVGLGDIPSEICRFVERAKIDLVVAGTHGSKGFERWLIGSVTEKLMRHCPVPLLVVGGRNKAADSLPEIQRILATTDFSEGTAHALNYAFSIAQEAQAEVDLLHVVDDLALIGPTANVRESLIDGVRKKLDRLVPSTARSSQPRTTVAIGVPYQAILKTARKDKAGMIVMNIHGKGMLDRVLVGSTAERVVRGAACPVLLIPPRAAAKPGSGSKKARAA